MTKRITFVCLFVFAVAGLKAQTYCYHCYKQYDKFDVPEPKNFYEYYTFKDDLMFESEKDGGGRIIDGKRTSPGYYKLKEIGDDGTLMYVSWTDLFTLDRSKYQYDYGLYILVSPDRSELNKVANGYFLNKIKVSDPFTACYKRCPDGDCEKSTVPSMKH